MPLVSVYLRRNLKNDEEKSSNERQLNMPRPFSKLSTIDSHLIELDIEVFASTPREIAQMIYERIPKASVDEAYNFKSLAEPVEALPKRCFADIQGFKRVFIKDLLNGPPNPDTRLLCWLMSRPRDHSAILFLSVCDSTGAIQVVVDKSKVPSWAELRTLRSESSKHYRVRNGSSKSGES